MPPRKRKHLAPDTPLTPVPSEILDQFVGQGPLSVEELEAAVRRFKKAIVERALGGELTHHLGYPPGGVKPEDAANHRNGTSGKTVLTDDGPLAIDVPRDRAGTFEPRLIPKHARRFAGFDDKILALYARGMTVREIQAFLAEMYAVEVSPDLIYTTNALESVNARIRKIIKTRGHFPTDEAATKLVWLALRNITAGWGGKASNYWHLAMQQFAILYEDRFTTPAS
jgi:transposase-like protein